MTLKNHTSINWSTSFDTSREPYTTSLIYMFAQLSVIAFSWAIDSPLGPPNINT